MAAEANIKKGESTIDHSNDPINVKADSFSLSENPVPFR